jgi:hypothetical protein
MTERGDGEGPAYNYKPSLLGAPWEFRLLPAALEWRIGRRSGQIDYADITAVRLSFRPVSLQSARFLAEIWANGSPKLTIASTSWHSVFDVRNHGSDYSAFVAELHRRLARIGTRARFTTGTSPLIYWIGLPVFVAAALGFAALTTRAIKTGPWTAAVLIGAFLAIFLWQLGNYFRRNRPGRYRPDRLPEPLLPRP